MQQIEWLLDCKPREVQLEAIARSFYGIQRFTDNAEPLDEPIPIRNGAARGWAHWLDMRLGKTPTLLNEIMLFRTHFGLRRGVIYAPNTYKPEWAREAELFGVDIPFYAAETSSFRSMIPKLRKESEWFVVVNFEGARSQHVQQFIMEEVQGDDVMHAIDESIAIKNPQSLTTKYIMNMGKEAWIKRVLSGRPQTQGPHDLYAQFRFIGEQDGKNFYSFRNRFCKMGGFKNKKVVGVNTDRQEELREIKARCSFVAKRMHWGNTVKPDYVIDTVPISPVQQKLYMQMEEEFYALWEETGQEVSADQVITKLLKQQQIASGFVYDDDRKVINLFDDPKKIPKMERTLQILEETDGKALVFYHYNQSGDHLVDLLKGYNPALIRSKMWMKKNGYTAEEEKDKFNNDETSRIAICSISAVKYGNTLIGTPQSRAGLSVFYENTYSFDAREQVEVRNVHATETWPRTYIDFASTPVERNVAKALAEKTSLIEAVFGKYKD